VEKPAMAKQLLGFSLRPSRRETRQQSSNNEQQ
jgi:hypothetical protein